MGQFSQITLTLWAWLTAKQLSDVSAALNVIVVSVYALTLFGDPTILGLILVLKMTGAVAGAFLVPVLSRRWSRRWVLIFADVMNGILMLGLALAPQSSHSVLLLVLPFFMGLFHGTAHVALYAQVPQFLGADFRHQLNSILASMDGISVVAGGTLAGVLYEIVPLDVLLSLDGVTFLVSALVFYLLRVNKGPGKVMSSSKTVAPVAQRLRWTRGSVRLVFVAMGILMLARFMEAFGSSTHNVGFPIISAAFDPGDPAFLIGWIMAIWGLGKIASVFVTPATIRLLHRAGSDEGEMFIGFLIATFAFFLAIFLAVSLATDLALILIFAFFAGVFDASTETVYYAILQNSPVAPVEQLVSLSYFIERLGMGGGILLAGYLFSKATTLEVSSILYLGSAAVALSLLIALWIRRKAYADQHG